MKMRRLSKQPKGEHTMQQLSQSLVKEPTITDKEREDILRYVETEITQVNNITKSTVR